MGTKPGSKRKALNDTGFRVNIGERSWSTANGRVLSYAHHPASQTPFVQCKVVKCRNGRERSYRGRTGREQEREKTRPQKKNKNKKRMITQKEHYGL